MNTNNYVIAVGIDGSDSSRKALLWAIREAHARGGSVQAIHVWHWDFPDLRDAGTGSRMSQEADALLARELDSLPPHLLSGVSIAREAVEGKPAEVLVEAARTADVLVLGSHGRSRQIHQLLGSVSEACIRDAACPVVVLPLNYQDQWVPDTAGQQVSKS